MLSLKFPIRVWVCSNGFFGFDWFNYSEMQSTILESRNGEKGCIDVGFYQRHVGLFFVYLRDRETR